MAQKIKLHQHSDDFGVSNKTLDARRAHPVIRNWGATQYWTWRGGDAIVVLCNTTCYVVLRLGEKVAVYEAQGLKSALEQAGEDFSKYEVV